MSVIFNESLRHRPTKKMSLFSHKFSDDKNKTHKLVGRNSKYR